MERVEGGMAKDSEEKGSLSERAESNIGNYGLESPLVYEPLLFLSPDSGLA